MQRAVLLMLLCSSCVPRQPQVRPNPPGATATELRSAVGGGLFLQGFSIVWQARPHRISRLRLGAEGAVEGELAELEGRLFSEVRGGTWASGKMAYDAPAVDVLYAGLSAPGVALVPGEVELVIRGGLGPRDAEDKVPEASIESEIALPDGVWAGAVVWLTSIDVSTAPSHPNGYTPNSLAIDLGEPRLEGGMARVPVSARVEAAPTLDRVQRLKSYGATVRVRYALVLSESGTAFREVLTARLDNGTDTDEGPRRVPEDHVHLSLAVPEATRAVVGGLSGFSLDVRQSGLASGRYMRAMSAALQDERYDWVARRYEAEISLSFTNAGSAARPAQVDASATVSALALPTEARIVRGRWSPETASGAQCARYPDFESIDCPARPLDWEESASSGDSGEEDL